PCARRSQRADPEEALALLERPTIGLAAPIPPVDLLPIPNPPLLIEESYGCAVATDGQGVHDVDTGRDVVVAADRTESALAVTRRQREACLVDRDGDQALVRASLCGCGVDGVRDRLGGNLLVLDEPKCRLSCGGTLESACDRATRACRRRGGDVNEPLLAPTVAESCRAELVLSPG